MRMKLDARLRSSAARFGVDAEFWKDGADSAYRTARAIVAGQGRSGAGETFDERGRESGVTRVLYLLSDDAPPRAVDGYVAVSGRRMRVVRCEYVADGFWRAVCESEGEEVTREQGV